MRTYIVFFLLVVLLVGFAILLVIRERPDHETPLVATVTAVTSDGGATSEPDGGTTSERGSSKAKASKKNSGKTVASGDGGADDGDAATPEKLMDRPLRVIGLGWELISPGVVANRGTTPGEKSRFSAAGFDVHLSTSSKVVEIERALARGGADKNGADVAIIPLPVFVASYEQLRALSPRMFFVLGWSHGNEVLMAFQENSLLKLPRTKSVQLIAERGSPEHFFGLFALELSGVPPNRVDHVRRGDKIANAINLAALRQASHGEPAGAASRRYLLTTADANRLIPYVAIAPEGLINTEGDALSALCSVWLKGVDELRRDVPAAARKIASIQGAPEALELLGLLGRVESTTLRENARVAGLAGRDSVTLNQLFARTWRIWREADIITSPVPEEIPLNTQVISSMVRAGSSMADEESGTLGERQPAPRSALSNKAQPLLIHRLEGRFDEDALMEKIGFLASVFKPLKLRVAIPAETNSRARAFVKEARGRFSLSEDRIIPARKVTGRFAPAAIELMPN